MGKNIVAREVRTHAYGMASSRRSTDALQAWARPQNEGRVTSEE